jgi:hypothetical protein
MRRNWQHFPTSAAPSFGLPALTLWNSRYLVKLTLVLSTRQNLPPPAAANRVEWGFGLAHICPDGRHP